MNAYIIVEGKTEFKVYPKWLEHIAPKMKIINRLSDMKDNNYYLFCAGGIPSIYSHVANAAEDIIDFNSKGDIKIDFLLVCIDTEEESREYILEQIEKEFKSRGIAQKEIKLEVFEQKVSMESWFLANRKIYKANPDDDDLCRYIRHYNVKDDDPELMGIFDEDKFSTKAQFHHSYIRKIFAERNISYSKSNPTEVLKEDFLRCIIKRYQDTGHVASFGRWYNFVCQYFN